MCFGWRSSDIVGRARLTIGIALMIAAEAFVTSGSSWELRLRQDRRFDGIAFAASFATTAGQWTTVELPLGSFEPTYRGFRPRNAGPLDPSEIGQVGIMLTDKQEGPFRLEIDWIGVDRGTGPR